MIPTSRVLDYQFVVLKIISLLSSRWKNIRLIILLITIENFLDALIFGMTISYAKTYIR